MGRVIVGRVIVGRVIVGRVIVRRVIVGRVNGYRPFHRFWRMLIVMILVHIMFSTRFVYGYQFGSFRSFGNIKYVIY